MNSYKNFARMSSKLHLYLSLTCMNRNPTKMKGGAQQLKKPWSKEVSRKSLKNGWKSGGKNGQKIGTKIDASGSRLTHHIKQVHFAGIKLRTPYWLQINLYIKKWQYSTGNELFRLRDFFGSVIKPVQIFCPPADSVIGLCLCENCIIWMH